MRKFKGIIFDFNGTLFMDTPKHEMAWRNYAKQELGITIEQEEYYLNLHGRTNSQIYEYLYKKPQPPELFHKFGQPKEEYYRKLCREEKDILTLTDGAVELLDLLNQKNIPHAIATSSDIINVTFFKEIFPLDRWFSDDRIIYDDGSVKGKPHPDLYLKAGDRLGISMSELIIVEDAYSGVLAAKNSGAGYVIGITPDDKNEFLGKELTDTVINNFFEFDRSLFI